MERQISVHYLAGQPCSKAYAATCFLLYSEFLLRAATVDGNNALTIDTTKGKRRKLSARVMK